MKTIVWVAVKFRRYARTAPLVVYLVGCTFPGAGTVSAQSLGGKLKPGTVALRDAGAPSLVVSAVPGSIPYRLAQACDAANPLLTFTVQVANQGTGASPAQPAAIVVAEDVSLSPPWTGQATLPAMARGQVLAVNIPVMVYSQPAAMKGTHMFRITVRGTPSSTSSINLQVNIPDGLCAAAINQRSAPGSPAPPAFTPPLKTVMGGQLKGSTATTGQQLPANTEVAKNAHILGQPAGTPASLPHAMTVTGAPPTLPQGRGYIKMVLGSGQTVSGEVREPAHAGWLEFTHEADPPLAADPTTKPGEAKHIVADIAITKTTDKTSPVLMQAAANGTRFKEVGMDFVRKDASGQEFVYQRFKLADVVVSSIRPGGSGEHGPTESVRLHYTSLSTEPVGVPLAATTPLKTATLPGPTTPTTPMKTATPLGSLPPPAHATKLSPEEFRARLKAFAAAHKVGPITTVPVALEQSKHIEMMAILNQQKARVEMARSAILAAKITSRSDTAPSLSSQTPAPARGGPAAPVSVGGNGNTGSRTIPTVSHLPIPCGEPNITTVNGLPPPQQSFGASGGKGGIQPGYVKTANQNVPQFTTIPEFNRYTIEGCGFGVSGQLYLTGSVKQINPMTVESWTDTSIVASLPDWFIEADHDGDVTLEVHPKSAPTIQITGCNFYALRAEQHLSAIPVSEVSFAAVKDLAENNVTAYVEYPCAGSFGPCITQTEVVGRYSPASFPSAQDTFGFSKMSPGFYVKGYTVYIPDITDPSFGVCNTSTSNDIPIITSYGNWSARWDASAKAIRVTTAEQTCVYPSSEATSFSSYMLDVWVVGPQGIMNPWVP